MSDPFNLCRSIPLNHLRQINYPNFVDARPIEHKYGTLIHSKAFFKEVVALQEICEVQNRPWCRNFQMHYSVICHLRVLEVILIFKQIDEE